MATPRYFSKALHILITILFSTTFPIETSTSLSPINRGDNCSSSCGDIHKITHPFRLETNQPSCGGSIFGGYTLSCKKNRTIFTIKSQQYYVQSINYNNYTIRVSSPNVLDNKNNISSLPDSSISSEDIPRNSFMFSESEVHTGEIQQVPEALEYSSCESSNCSFTPLFSSLEIFETGGYYTTKSYPKLETVIRFGRGKEIVRISEDLKFLRCEKAVIDNPLYISTSPWINNSDTSKDFSYVVFGNGFKFSDIEDSCEIVRSTLVSSPAKGRNRTKASSYFEVHAELVYGFELSWVQAFDEGQNVDCYVDGVSNEVRCPSTFSGLRELRVILQLFYVVIIAALNADVGLGLKVYTVWIIQRVFALAFVMGLVIYTWTRRHQSEYANIEAFLRSSNNQTPSRYTYSEIRKMTSEFKTKLGQGGFGSVYKAKLRNGREAAIKILSKSKGDGEDFINEVATIGRIHHVNVVRLVGFCVEGSNRALVYDFMPNGSLDKYIFSGKDTADSLSDEKLFEISLGIARGIEYLHRGCEMQILHFDIKPHNILLDQNFVPKVSDFGLATLCPSDNSMVPLTAARGTLGYMAPELFYKNIREVSHKSDVYSFGMLLMEMANRRKNVDTEAQSFSQFFVPLRVYDDLKEEKWGNCGKESETTKKMIMVALWCIQSNPLDRPSMREVIEMLEGDVKTLEMPSRPNLFPQENRDESSYWSSEKTSKTRNATSSCRDDAENSSEISLI